MTYPRQRLKEVTALKREAVRRIKNDIGEIGASPSQKYIHEFTREFQTFESVVAPAEILEAARRAKLILFGEYHSLTRKHSYEFGFLRELKTRKYNTVLGAGPPFGLNPVMLFR